MSNTWQNKWDFFFPTIWNAFLEQSTAGCVKWQHHNIVPLLLLLLHPLVFFISSAAGASGRLDLRLRRAASPHQHQPGDRDAGLSRTALPESAAKANPGYDVQVDRRHWTHWKHCQSTPELKARHSGTLCCSFWHWFCCQDPSCLSPPVKHNRLCWPLTRMSGVF